MTAKDTTAGEIPPGKLGLPNALRGLLAAEPPCREAATVREIPSSIRITSGS